MSGFFPEQAILYLNDPTQTGGPVVIFRDQLRELAEYLDRETDLGTRPARFLLESSGVEAIIGRDLSPLATHYLKSIPDLAIAHESLIAQLATELEKLITGDMVTRTWQLTVAGVKPDETYRHREVELRPLTPGERGAFLGLKPQPRQFRPVPFSDLVLPANASVQVMPSALISVQVTRPRGELPYASSLLNRVVLAFFLAGYKLSSSGTLGAFDHPVWVTGNGYYPPSPVHEKLGTPESSITAEAFRAVTELAYETPDIDMTEASGQGIVLSRMLRAYGANWQEPTFLDFITAIEVALLQGRGRGIRSRFASYGALFLKAELDHTETLARLAKLYKLRSTLVHGGAVAANDLYLATQEAAELAGAVVRRAIEHGWPDPKELEVMASEFRL